MGYLHRTTGIPNFSKAIASIWFRVPNETFTELFALTDNPDDSDNSDHFCSIAFTPPLYKTIPLISFGSQEVTTAQSSVGAGEPVSPSFIGIDCALDDPVLAVNLQMSNFATGDVDPELVNRPECFYMSGGNGLSVGQKCPVVADQWHNALVSFDLSLGCSSSYNGGVYSFDPGPLYSWTLNDVGKVGSSMFPAGGREDEGAGENGIVPYGLVNGLNTGIEGASASWSPVSITSSGNALGVPTSVPFTAHVHKIQMARLQFFTGEYADVTTEEVRRVFITAGGAPADVSLARNLFGTPVIEFRTANDWINGRNTGSGGNFTKVGTVTAYAGTPVIGS